MRLLPVLLLAAACGRTVPHDPQDKQDTTQLPSPTCAAGTADCDGDGQCEADLNDVSTCGSCGSTCAAPNATPACTSGRCAVASCDAGFGDCDGVLANGCEASLDTDGFNCGACGRSCPDGQACRAGACTQLTWTQLPSGQIPARRLYGATYDSARERVVLFGGQSANDVLLSDTWEWDGRTWTEVRTAQSPGARRTQVMAYDPDRKVSVLFGGARSFNTCGADVLGDTWEFDGTRWTQVMLTPSPPPRQDAMLAWDRQRHVMVMFGGTICGNGRIADTWEYDGKRWTQRTPSASPPQIGGAGVAFDARRGRITVFGGAGNNVLGLQDGLWEYDGSTWAMRTVSGGPSARAWMSMVDASVRNAIVMFGGSARGATPQSFMVLDETWEWNGERWRRIRPTRSPGPRTATGVYDEARRQVVLFSGGTTNDTWVYPGP